MTRSGLERDLAGLALDGESRRRIAEAFGHSPRAALSALVGYGLEDHEIARYHGLDAGLVGTLRALWEIDGRSP